MSRVNLSTMTFEYCNIISSFITILVFSILFEKADCQGSFVINKVFYDTEEWVVKDTYLGHHLSGDLLNKPGKLTEYGTDLGRYVHRADIDGSSGICVKLKENGSWQKITCPGPKAEKLIDNQSEAKKYLFHVQQSLQHYNLEQDNDSDFPTCNKIFSQGFTPKPGVNCIHTEQAKPNRTPVVNSFREWVIRRKDLNIAGQDTKGPICVKLRPDGTWENETIPCN